MTRVQPRNKLSFYWRGPWKPPYLPHYWFYLNYHVFDRRSGSNIGWSWTYDDPKVLVDASELLQSFTRSKDPEEWKYLDMLSGRGCLIQNSRYSFLSIFSLKFPNLEILIKMMWSIWIWVSSTYALVNFSLWVLNSRFGDLIQTLFYLIEFLLISIV